MVWRSVEDRKHELEKRNALKKQLLFFNTPNMMNNETKHYKTLLQNDTISFPMTIFGSSDFAFYFSSVTIVHI